MSSQVRLLPTLIGAAGVLLCLRLGALAANTPEGGAAEAAPAAAEQAEPKEAAGNAAPDANAAPAPAAPAAEPPGATASDLADAVVPRTKGEADVLQRLGERRDALDAREKNIALREQMLMAAERQVDSKLSELKALEQKLQVVMTKRNEEEEAQLVALVKSYESMKPLEAARIFNRLERSILVDVASRMKPAKIGSIMAAMEPARAQDLTVLLARRLKLSQAMPAAPAMPPAAPAMPMPAADAPEGTAPPRDGAPPASASGG